MSNPFAPPQSSIADIADGARKPKAVWLLQIVATLLAGLFGLGLLKGMLSMFAAGSTASMGFMVHLVVDVVVLWFLVQTTIASQKRRSLGRWLGLLFIGVVFAVSFYAGCISLADAGNPANASAEYRAGHAVGSIGGVILIVCACAFWFRSFGFGPSARQWFGVATGAVRRASDEWRP